jgi:hypothetical protein
MDRSIQLIFIGDYPRELPGIGTFAPGHVVSDELKVKKILRSGYRVFFTEFPPEQAIDLEITTPIPRKRGARCG